MQHILGHLSGGREDKEFFLFSLAVDKKFSKSNYQNNRMCLIKV
jgi:hypothetical protein